MHCERVRWHCLANHRSLLRGVAGLYFTARIQRGSSETARCASTEDHQAPALPLFPAPCFPAHRFAILLAMSIRNAAGKWEPMLLGIEARICKVCKEELYRNKTFLSGGWSRCALCEDFVHYTCLANGKVSFLKARPRVCKICRTAQEDSPSSPKASTPVAVGS